MKLCDYGCGKEATHQFKNGKWCCSWNFRSCSQMKEKKKQTFIEKYGIDNPSQNKEFQEKKKQTWLEKYGSEHPFQSKEVQEKRRQTWIKKYGVENPSQNKEVQEKKRQTFIEKYGVDNPSQNKEIQEKRKQTHMEKYGVENYKQSLEAKEIFLKNHSFLCQIEEIKIEDNQFKTHCKNSNCQNSKEKRGWFIPTSVQINNRIAALKIETGNGGNFFYCSEHCKITCDAFNVHGDPERDTQLPYTQEQYQAFRLEVLTRDNYICQYCGGIATVVHHEKPVKLYPESALDPDYAWSCCGECHYAKGHPKGTACSTGRLAAKVCNVK